jgi:hypothetical protein
VIYVEGNLQIRKLRRHNNSKKAAFIHSQEKKTWLFCGQIDGQRLEGRQGFGQNTRAKMPVPKRDYFCFG